MSFWNSADGIEGTALEVGTQEQIKCECGCDCYFPNDIISKHPITGEMISYDCLEAYNESIDKD